MRAEVVAALVDLAEADERIVFVTGDLGYGVVEPFFERLPDRAFNAGVAEQNMVAMATGLAEAGLIPFVYSIATFATLRPYEFIRNGPVVHHLPVRVIGVGGGMEYANNGPSHFALEDVAVMRTQPGLRIVCPNDTTSAVQMLVDTYTLPGPIYYRLSKQTVNDIPGFEHRSLDVAAGAQVLSQGDGTVAVLALGAIANQLGGIVDTLAGHGLSATTVAVWNAAPAPVDLIAQIARDHDMVVTVEAHYSVGGLGSLVAEVIAEAGTASRLVRCAVEQVPNGVVGTPAHLARWARIDVTGVVERILAARGLVGR
jgi:transketolase